MIATGSCYLGISQERDRANSARVVVARKSRAVRQCDSRDKQHGDMDGAARLDENPVEPDDEGRPQFGRLRGCCEKATRAIGDGLQESARRDSQGRNGPLPRERTSVADLRWIDARCQIADYFTKRAARKSE